MRRIGVFVLGALLLSPSVFLCAPVSAQEPAVATTTRVMTNIKAQSFLPECKITLTSQGKIVGVLTFQKDEGAQLSYQADRFALVQEKDSTKNILTGKVSLRLTRGEKQILALTADEAILEITNPDL